MVKTSMWFGRSFFELGPVCPLGNAFVLIFGSFQASMEQRPSKKVWTSFFLDFPAVLVPKPGLIPKPGYLGANGLDGKPAPMNWFLVVFKWPLGKTGPSHKT